jgi:ADP-L-glycero-D-manno-heptose 6-epimerase
VIVVTGGAGFIGSNLVAGLEDAGKGPICVVDRLGTDDKWKNLRGRELDELVDPGDLDGLLQRRVRDVQYVIHMGAISSTTESDADRIIENNFRLSQHLWRWCAHHDVPLIYASSGATYGDGSQGFDDDSALQSLAELVPMSPYAWSKHLFDRWVARAMLGPGPKPRQWAGLKFFNVYGPNEYHKGDMRSVIAKAYPTAAAGRPVTLFRSNHPDYEDGGQMRDFVYVQDCVEVMLWLVENDEVSGLFNVGTGRAQSWLQLMEALHSAVGQKLEVDWIDIPESIGDRYQNFTEAPMTRLRGAGYEKPFRSVEEGVADYVERFLATDDPYR